MLQNIIINQVTSLIKGAIERFAKENEADINDIALWIYPKYDPLNYLIEDLPDGIKLIKPGLKLLHKLKFIKDIEFGDLATKFQKITYSGMGFNIEKETPIWIQKFMKRVSIEKNIDIMVPSYYLRIYNNELIAFMFLNNEKAIFFPDADDSIDKLAKYKISIDYILQTR